MKVYVSGKISGLDWFECVSNFYAARSEAVTHLSGEGYVRQLIEVVLPVDNGLPWGASWLRHLWRDLQLLAKCDVVWMQGNWRDSRGARIERQVANLLKKRVIYAANSSSDNKKMKGLVK